MISVVVPAHDEAALIGACLRSLARAAADPALGGEAVQVFVVLDRCGDGTADIAAALGVHCIVLTAGNVGIARARGFEAAIAAGARWIATTDADSEVPGDWLSAQLAHGCDAFCGVITVSDWREHDDRTRDEFLRTECRLDDHPHVHGANFGVTALAYGRSGGFLPLAAHEDVALVRALVSDGARIARRLQPVVVTSARRRARASGGFGDYLLLLEARLRESEPPAVSLAAVAQA